MNKYSIYFILIVTLASTAFFVWSFVFAEHNGSLTVNFFDIGQGDASLVEVPGGFQILIDGGPDSSVLSKLGEAMPKTDKAIELVVISHPDKDHISGLVEVFRRYTVSHVLATMVMHNLADYEELKKIISEKNIPVTIARAPLRISWGEGYMDVLYPFELPGEEVKDVNTNETSIVGKLVFGNTTILFTGDLEAGQETELIYRGIDISADILKVAHHGSRSSSTQRFLEAVNPAFGVVSVGRDNRYGHPHQEVLNRLEQNNVIVLRTDTSGDIVLESNGVVWSIVEN